MTLMNLWELGDLEVPWSLRVVATLRIADLIAEGHEEIADLAKAAGADADSLQRVLRLLVMKGLFEEPAPGRFALNDAARGLIGEGRIAFDLHGFGGRLAGVWSTLLSAVISGKPAYREAFGRDYWEDLEANPKLAREFDVMMGPGHGPRNSDLLFDLADWASIRTVADIGGGTGSLLAAVLREHPHLRGFLVDLPRTLERAIQHERMTPVGQSFFDPLPPGLDLYMMDRVLNDWPDDDARRILTRIAEALPPTGRLMVLAGVTGRPTASPELLMMVLVGGKNRTLEEFTALAERAGLRVTNAGVLRSGRYAVECRKR